MSGGNVKKLESYYQEILEKWLNGKRSYLGCGITDITTSEMHVEIKNWKTWKHALGQLLVYKSQQWRPRLYAVFFGSTKLSSKDTAVKVFKEHGIGLYEIVDLDEDEFYLNLLVDSVDAMDVDS